jgi:predicted enzyme related to lactoylglutathione lyase
MKRVTGLGGIFFKSDTPNELNHWYDKHLGLSFNGQSYSTFRWRDFHSNIAARTEFSLFKKDTSYFAPSDSHFMLNFRVENLENLLNLLIQEGVRVIGEMETYPYGKFGWILDPEGNKIELWEPIEEGFDDDAGK